MLPSIIIANLISSLASLIGGFFLVLNGKIAKKFSLYLVALAAGAMITAAFVDLLPEALKLSSDPLPPIHGALVGFIAFFLLERFLLWFHHHHEHTDPSLAPTKIILVLGDSLHNFLDGVIIAGSFLADARLGVLSALLVGLHEIPQEIGDFGALLHLGTPRRKVLLVNLLSAFFAVLGGVLGFYFFNNTQGFIPSFLGFAAGSFIYIAASDLIPELHVGNNRSEAVKQTAAFSLGVFLILIVTYFIPE